MLFSFISHPRCLVTVMLPHTCKRLVLWLGHWKEFPNSVPTGIRVVSLPFPHTHRDVLSAHGRLRFLNSQQKPRHCSGFDLLPNKFLQFSQLWSSFSCDRESLAPSWARPGRTITLILPRDKCRNPVKHEIPVVLQCECKNLTPQTCSNPFTCAAGLIVEPDFWTVQFPGLHFIVRKGRVWERHLWERSSEHWDDLNTSEDKAQLGEGWCLSASLSVRTPWRDRGCHSCRIENF